MVAMGLCLMGCSKAEPPKYSVTGEVVYKDTKQTIPGGLVVIFESTSPPYTRSSSRIEASGHFTLGTSADGNGSIVGPHRVRFTGVASESQPDPAAIVAFVMDKKYADFGNSGIKLDIQPNDNNHFVIEVDRGSAKGELPKAVQEANDQPLVAPENEQ